MGRAILSVVPFSNLLAIGINARALPSHPRFKAFGFYFLSTLMLKVGRNCHLESPVRFHSFTHVALARHFITHQTMSDWSAERFNRSWTMSKHSSTFRAVLVGFFGGLIKTKRITRDIYNFIVGHLSPLLTKCSALTLKHFKHSIYFCG